MKSMVLLSCLCLALVGTGCSSGDDASDPSHQPDDDSPVWRSTSSSLELYTVSLIGSREYKVNRSDLTAAQSDALAHLHLIERPTRPPFPDAGSYLLRVVDEDGSVRDYLSAVENVNPESMFKSRGVEHYSTIDFETFDPLRVAIE